MNNVNASPLEIAKESICKQKQTLETISERLNQSFNKAVFAISNCKGKLAVCGMGKAGLIGKKIASTFSSLGMPSFFLHPAEASHGDLGMIDKKDVILMLSNSGDSEEIVNIIPSIKLVGCFFIALTGNSKSLLAQKANCLIDMGPIEEVDKLGLAPTASTTAMLVIGDALATAMLQQKKTFTKKDFAFLHPGGSLGKKLLEVHQIMKKAKNAVLVREDETVKNVLIEITNTKLGCAMIVDEQKKLLGIFSDGDLRRHLKNDSLILEKPIHQVMTPKPKFITPNAYALEALTLMKKHQIGELPVVNENAEVLGILSMKDLVQIGIL